MSRLASLRSVVAVLVAAGALSALPAAAQPVPALDFCEPPVALTDLLGGTYCGVPGGLYDGTNAVPTAHAAEGVAEAAAVRPRATDGTPDPTNGRVVLLSIGMSNATQEWCHAQSTGASGAPPCNPWTLMGQAATDPAVDHATLAIANGARGGQALYDWDAPDEANYDLVRDAVLAPDALTEAQVQAIWIKAALAGEPSRPALPAPAADAVALEPGWASTPRPATSGRLWRRGWPGVRTSGRPATRPAPTASSGPATSSRTTASTRTGPARRS